MPNTRVLNRSFGGGELSPEMYGRIDDSKYQSGAAVMRNFIASPQGPAENRAGFALVREVKDSSKKTRIISFTFSTVQTMVIEIGEGYFRFHTQGQTLITGTPAAWNSGTAYEVGDLVSLSGSNYYCTADNTNQTPPNASYWYLIPTQAYEVPHPYLEDELFDIKFVQSADVLTLVHPNHKPRELRRLGATKWVVTEINFGTPISAPTGAAATRYIPASASINTDTYETMRYQVTAVSTDLINESGVSNTASVDNNIFVSGAKNTITWNAVTGASRYNVYKYQGGVYGYIGSSTTTSIEDNNIAPDFSKTPPIFDNDFVSAGNYPGAVSYFEQRRCFAGTTNEPQKIWMTKSGTESNMSYSLPVQDDNRIEFKVAAREANTIRHIVPLTELLLLTGSAEWRVTSVNSDAITPTSISVRPQSYVGASNVQPAIINNSMVYAAARGGHVRELGYNWQSNGFATNDLSLRAAHLFDNKDITDMAFSKAPIPIVWMTSTDGKLLGLTYVPEQQVGAWHRHDTDGTFESVAVVAEGSEDILYAVIKRHINGSDVRFIERLQSRQFDLPEDAFFVDCGATYDGNNTTSETMTVTGGTLWDSSETLTITSSQAIFNAPPSTSDKDDVVVLADADGNKYRCKILTTTSTTVATVQVDNTLPVSLRGVATTSWAMARNEISGLDYLEGKTVNILATGAVHPQRVVTGGKITLDRAAAKIHIGLPIQADLQTLPLAINIEAYGQGRYKNINHVWLRVFQSSGIFVGPDPDNLVEAKQRTNEPYGSPPALKSEDIKIMLTPSWQDEGQIYVRQSDPLPLTIVGLTIEVAIGGQINWYPQGILAGIFLTQRIRGGLINMTMQAAPTPPTLFGMDMQTVGQIGMVGQVFGGLSSAVGAYFGAKSAQLELQSKASNLDYQSKMAKINARMSEMQAQQIMRAGQFAQMTQTMKAGQQMGSYRASLAARGGQAGEGSTQEVMASAVLMKDLDRMTLNSNTVRAAEAERMKKVGYQNQSTLLGVSAANAMASAGTISPFSATTTSLLGSTTSVANSWYNMNRQYAGA